ncbi:MAG: hypothetical protein V7709_10890 [Halioglobus sp.]
MSFFRNLCCALLIAPSAWAAGPSDMVNERIPVSKLELEAHWRVDCKHSWNDFIGRTSVFEDQAECVIPVKLQRQIQLCAFIYQPPGEASPKTCRDFDGARRAAIQANCLAMALLLEESANCKP